MVVSFRFDDSLLVRLNARVEADVADGRVKDRTHLVEELILAHLEARAPFTPRHPNAFPEEEPNLGTDPSSPLLISK